MIHERRARLTSRSSRYGRCQVRKRALSSYQNRANHSMKKKDLAIRSMGAIIPRPIIWVRLFHPLNEWDTMDSFMKRQLSLE